MKVNPLLNLALVVGGVLVCASPQASRAQSIYEPYSFSTLAGVAGVYGPLDGSRGFARFNGPYDVAVDSAGNVYVADLFNRTIPKITPAGVVSTLAGLAGNSGSADGAGSAARFNRPTG